jgi:DNA-binding MarR family transcriptional regulator
MGVAPDEAGELGFELIRLVKLLQSLKQAYRIHPAVETTAFPMLFSLMDGPRRVSNLAECVHSDTSTISRQVSTLAAEGLLEKVADPQDGRVQMVSLTSSGKELLDRVRADRAELFRTLLHEWSAADIGEFTAYVHRFARDLEKWREGVTRTPVGAATTPSTPSTPSTAPTTTTANSTPTTTETSR